MQIHSIVFALSLQINKQNMRRQPPLQR